MQCVEVPPSQRCKKKREPPSLVLNISDVLRFRLLSVVESTAPVGSESAVAFVKAMSDAAAATMLLFTGLFSDGTTRGGTASRA